MDKIPEDIEERNNQKENELKSLNSLCDTDEYRVIRELISSDKGLKEIFNSCIIHLISSSLQKEITSGNIIYIRKMKKYMIKGLEYKIFSKNDLFKYIFKQNRNNYNNKIIMYMKLYQRINLLKQHILDKYENYEKIQVQKDLLKEYLEEVENEQKEYENMREEYRKIKVKINHNKIQDSKDLRSEYMNRIKRNEENKKETRLDILESKRLAKMERESKEKYEKIKVEIEKKKEEDMQKQLDDLENWYIKEMDNFQKLQFEENKKNYDFIKDQTIQTTKNIEKIEKELSESLSKKITYLRENQQQILDNSIKDAERNRESIRKDIMLHSSEIESLEINLKSHSDNFRNDIKKLESNILNFIREEAKNK